MLGNLNDVITSSTATRRSSGTIVSYVWHLKKYHNAEMVFDPSNTVINESDLELQDRTSCEFGHVQGREEIPSNMLEP
jgi:hypothetical protein